MIICEAMYGANKKPPVYTYTGKHNLVPDAKGYRLELLTSGALTFQKLNSFRHADACAVGGGGSGNRWAGNGYGGGGGAGGDVENVYGIALEENVPYEITIGDGGLCDVNGANGNGKPTIMAGIVTANGGSQGESGSEGGKGGNAVKGSGGGSSNSLNSPTPSGAGGSDGSDGGAGHFPGGIGSHKTTRPFADPAMDPLAAGGGAGSYKGAWGNGGEVGGGSGGQGNGTPGTPNTGSGGGGSGYNAKRLFAPGGTGVMMLRNRRRIL